MSDDVKFNIVLIVGVFSLLLIVSAFASLPPQAAGAEVVASAYCADGYDWPDLTARAAYVEDLSTKNVLFKKNSEAQLPLASLTKLMTVLTALDSLSTDETIQLTPEALTPEGDAGLYAREVWKVGALIDFTLMSSANDGAHALALAAAQKRGFSIGQFIFSMDEKAKRLNMSQTFFLNDTGLDAASTTPGAMGSARDVGFLLRDIFQNHSDAFQGSAAPERTFVSVSGKTHTVENTSTIGATVPEAIVSKTGFTDLAGGNLAIIFEPLLGHPVAAVILGSTREGRDMDMQMLADAVRSYLKRDLLCHAAL